MRSFAICQLVPYVRLINAGIGVEHVRYADTPVHSCHDRFGSESRLTDLNRWPSLCNESCLEIYSTIRGFGFIADCLINQLVNLLFNYLRPSCHGASY